MISMAKALDGVSTFATKDVISAMPNNPTKFLALMAVGSMRNNPQTFVKPYETMLKGIGIMSEDGSSIDTDSLRDALSEAFSQIPKLNWMGFTFTAEDADRLLQRLEG